MQPVAQRTIHGMVICYENGCIREATIEVRLSLRNNPNHSRAISTPLICSCDLHAQVTWDELVTPDFWRSLCALFRDNGLAVPSVLHSELVFVRIPMDQ